MTGTSMHYHTAGAGPTGGGWPVCAVAGISRGRGDE